MAAKLKIGEYVRPNGKRLPCFQFRKRRGVKQVQVGRGEWINVEKGSLFDPVIVRRFFAVKLFDRDKSFIGYWDNRRAIFDSEKEAEDIRSIIGWGGGGAVVTVEVREVSTKRRKVK